MRNIVIKMLLYAIVGILLFGMEWGMVCGAGGYLLAHNLYCCTSLKTPMVLRIIAVSVILAGAEFLMRFVLLRGKDMLYCTQWVSWIIFAGLCAFSAKKGEVAG